MHSDQLKLAHHLLMHTGLLLMLTSVDIVYFSMLCYWDGLFSLGKALFLQYWMPGLDNTAVCIFSTGFCI